MSEDNYYLESNKTNNNTPERSFPNDKVAGLSSPITTGLLTLENLLKSYDDRLKILEAKCANIV